MPNERAKCLQEKKIECKVRDREKMFACREPGGVHPLFTLFFLILFLHFSIVCSLFCIHRFVDDLIGESVYWCHCMGMFFFSSKLFSGCLIFLLHIFWTAYRVNRVPLLNDWKMNLYFIQVDELMNGIQSLRCRHVNECVRLFFFLREIEMQCIYHDRQVNISHMIVEQRKKNLLKKYKRKLEKRKCDQAIHGIISSAVLQSTWFTSSYASIEKIKKFLVRLNRIKKE